MLLIGSRALEKYVSCGRSLKDYDYIATPEEVDNWIVDYMSYHKSIKRTDDCLSAKMNNGEFVELHIAKPGSALVEYLKLNEGRAYASLETLYSIKLGHVHYSKNQKKFDKHIHDINLMGALCHRNDTLKRLTKMHNKDTESRIGKLKTPSLKMSTDEFFDQSEKFVKPLFVHDDIHKVMAHKENPMFTYMQSDIGSVECSKTMWQEFTTVDKIHCVLEEAYVIALERKIIPMVFGEGQYLDSETAFGWALWRICTNLCSGWFRRFAIDYYSEIIGYHNQEYASKFFNALDSSKINFLVHAAN